MTRHQWNWLAGGALFVAGAWVAQLKAFGGVPSGLRALPIIGDWAAFSYSHEYAIYGLLLVVAAFAKLRSLSRTRDERTKAIQAVLDVIQVEVMKSPTRFNPRDYRVTLFRRKKWSWRGWMNHRREFPTARPWSGWLVPIARSGDDSVSSTTRFFAPAAQVANGHGVCGTAWLKGSADIHSLPSINQTSNEADVLAYSTGAHISVEEVRHRAAAGQSLARALVGERVRTKLTRRWGVVVYDSIDPVPIIDDTNRSGHKVGLQSLALLIEEYGQ